MAVKVTRQDVTRLLQESQLLRGYNVDFVHKCERPVKLTLTLKSHTGYLQFGVLQAFVHEGHIINILYIQI